MTEEAMTQTKTEDEDLYQKGMVEESRRCYSSAREIYQRLSDKGHANAMVNLGAMYSEGKGEPKNINMAIDLFLKASAHGETKFSLANVAFLYQRDLKDYPKALDTYCQYFEQKGDDKEKSDLIAKHMSHSLDMISLLFQQYCKLRQDNALLLQEVNSLRTELQYQPGGEGYLEAQNHFQSLQETV